MLDNLDTGRIRNWHSIVTLIVFVLANLIVRLPFRIPVLVHRLFWNFFRDALIAIRVIPASENCSRHGSGKADDGSTGTFVTRFKFPVNHTTGPLIAVLFLLAISAIGREEVRSGTIGTNSVFPLDILLFFGSLTYLAISINASGLFRYVIFKVLQRGGSIGHRLFFYLYLLFFGLATFVGSIPVILSSTSSLVFMTRISSNIVHPRAWIYMQFAISNIASAILVPSNPANLVLAGAFNIKFFHYTANTIVPVIVTAIFLFPFLLYVIFADQALIPFTIQLHELPWEGNARKPVNSNIPRARGEIYEGDDTNLMRAQQEILNPYLDKRSALVGSIVLVATLVVLLALNTATTSTKQYPAFWVTLPAAFTMFLWDVASGWFNRHETREIARKGREEDERMRNEQEMRDKADELTNQQAEGTTIQNREPSSTDVPDERTQRRPSGQRATLVSSLRNIIQWSQETFPVAVAVLSNLPFSFVPFTLSMFVLIHALYTKGWILVFAHGWDNWVTKTGTMGAIGGMSFLSVVLSNFSGTNIGASILLCRLIQTWELIRERNGLPISDRTFWGTVYSLAIGVNYGAFSATISASLTGLLWQSILTSRFVGVGSIDFIKVNAPIISTAMIIGCAVLVGEVYIMRHDSPYK